MNHSQFQKLCATYLPSTYVQGCIGMQYPTVIVHFYSNIHVCINKYKQTSSKVPIIGGYNNIINLVTYSIKQHYDTCNIYCIWYMKKVQYQAKKEVGTALFCIILREICTTKMVLNISRRYYDDLYQRIDRYHIGGICTTRR